MDGTNMWWEDMQTDIQNPLLVVCLVSFTTDMVNNSIVIKMARKWKDQNKQIAINIPSPGKNFFKGMTWWLYSVDRQLDKH